jgi:hypothetical protein
MRGALSLRKAQAIQDPAFRCEVGRFAPHLQNDGSRPRKTARLDVGPRVVLGKLADSMFVNTAERLRHS